jgi:hypothetical protein
MLMLFFYKSGRSVWSSAAWFGPHMEHGRNGYEKGSDIWQSYCARHGCKYIETLRSAEPGKLATSTLDLPAAGNTVPPCSIFPRVKFRSHFLNGVPAEIQDGGSRPGWMQANYLWSLWNIFFFPMWNVQENDQ